MICKGLLTLVCAILILTVSGQSGPSFHIAIIKDHISKGELSAIENLMKSEKDWTYSLIEIKKIRNKRSLKNFTHIWYHRTDTMPFDKDETFAGRAIKKYVHSGGNLFLSMESVPLLNQWGIEKTPLQLRQDILIDQGFGRPAGFHAFKSHPLFNGLNGGVYSTKQKKNHLVRKHGFFESAVPESGKVAGIQWTYITFSEQNKLLLEYNYGKGSIIAAGAFLYYDAYNYNSDHLHHFTKNVFRYTAGYLKNQDMGYWDYTPQTIKDSIFSLPVIKPVIATTWKLPKPTLSIKKDIATKDFYDLVGRRILWMGAMNGGVDEIWMHPYMALRDLELGVKMNGADSITWLKKHPSQVEITPECLTRIYHIKNTIIKEIYTVSFDEPNGVAHLEVEGNDVALLTLKYSSNLRYMWPYSHKATGNIRYAFNPAINGHVISGQNGALNTLVTYSSVPLRQKIWSIDSLNQVNVQADFSIKDKSAINIYIMGSSKSLNEAVQLFAGQSSGINKLFERSNQYYNDLLKNHLYFITPDTLFNKGYQWALARTDQFLQTTPGIGTALMAGFGTTARGWNGAQKISGRPGYAWYFGRDGQWSAMAINAYGDFAMVKETLETFIRFQDITGKIYHELTSSGAVHYDASDATPLFVVLAAHYLKYSGDTAYVRYRWAEIKKAMDFCYSTDTDKDGLIENTNVGHGWIEGGSLFGTHTEFYLAGTWAAALEAAAYMAQALELNEAIRYVSDAKKIKKIIDLDFWNPQEQFFHNGKMQDGSYMPDATVLASVPVYFGSVTDDRKAEKVSGRFSNNYFSTDWGIRMIEDSSKKYKAGSYHAGMVWPLYGGWASLSEYQTGHYRSGYQHIMNNLLQYRHWSAGSIEETLNGDVFIPNGVCSHQCWSETMVLQPAIEGMLGLKPDALKSRLELSPYFPWNWAFCSVRNIRMNDALVHLDMKRSNGLTMYTLTSNKAIDIALNPVFPLNTFVKSVKINGKKVQASKIVKPGGLLLKLSFLSIQGENLIEVETDGGMGILPITSFPQPGDTSIGIQVISETVQGKKYMAEVSGRPSMSYEIPLYNKEVIKKITGAKLIKKDGDITTLEIKLDSPGNQRYVNQKIEIEFE